MVGTEQSNRESENHGQEGNESKGFCFTLSKGSRRALVLRSR